MYPQNKAEAEPDEPLVYQIRLQGHLHPQWSTWFTGLTITQDDNSETLITGPVADQAALHGLLRKVRDLGMTLISVMQIEPHQKESSLERERPARLCGQAVRAPKGNSK